MGQSGSNLELHDDLEKNKEEFKDYGSVIKEAKPGDLLEFQRPKILIPYAHWGVYVGNGDVVNVQLDKEEGKKAGRIIKQSVKEVADGKLCRVNNLTELAQRKDLQANPPNVTVQIAEKHVGQQIDYNLITNNCECFSVSCRYNTSFSEQVDYMKYKLIDKPMVWGTNYYAKKRQWEMAKSRGWSDDEIMDVIYDGPVLWDD